MNLYEIDQAIMALCDPETGEILDWEAFDALQMERDIKIENVALWVKNLVADATAIRQEELNLAERRKAMEAKADRLKNYLKEALGGQKFQTARCSVSFRKTTKVALQDEGAVIDWAQRSSRDDVLKYTAPTVSKEKLAKVLKEGTEIPGAALEIGYSMTVK